MPLPDPHANEPTTEVNEDLYQNWVQAQAFANGWQERADEFKKMLMEQVGNTFAGTVNGVKVFTYRPENRYATSRLLREQEPLARHFMRQVLKEELDVQAFHQHHPDVVDLYRIRSFREVQ